MPDFTKEKWTDEYYDPDHFGFESEAHSVTTVDEDGYICLVAFATSEAYARVIASVPEMGQLLMDFCTIHDMKIQARKDNDPTNFACAFIAEEGAVNMAKELLARIDDKEKK